MNGKYCEPREVHSPKPDVVYGLLLVFLVINCVLFLQVGCQEQAGVAEGPETAPRASKPVVVKPEKAEPARQVDTRAPRIVIDKEVLDLGKVGPGTVNTGEFIITNAGDAVLEITKVPYCCGITTKLNKKTYAPGESGVLKVDYHATRLPTVIRREVVVHSNDKTRPEFTLTIKAEIIRKVACEPNRLRLFLKEKNAGCPQITLSSLDGQPFSIKAFKSTGDCITADVDSSVKATKFVLDAKVDMEKLEKNLKGRISINLTHPQCDLLTILFDVLPKFTINPPLIIVFDAEPQKPIVRKVSVLDNYGGDAQVESVSSKENTVRVLRQAKIRNGYQFEVEITPPADEGKTQFTDTLFINIEGEEKLGIICRGFYSRKKPETQ